MVEIDYKIQYFFFVSLMILSVEALQISILNFLSDFKCKTKIIPIAHYSGNKIFDGKALKPYNYEAFYQNSKVIAYIVDEKRFEEIARPDALGIRMEIGQELGRNNHELVVVGIDDCEDKEFVLIGAFLFNIIKPHPNQAYFKIETIGEDSFDQIYSILNHSYEKYREQPHIYNGTLQEYLRRSFPTMAYRSKRLDPSKIKEVRFFEDFILKRNYTRETTWPIFVENGKYIPNPNIKLNTIEHNFLKRHKNANCHILIVGGKDYNRLTSESLPWFEEIKKIMDKMRRKNEILFIMGCFNFDWSDVSVVPEIILKHSQLSGKVAYNVFTVGTGMYDTIFRNPNKYEKRMLKQSTNIELMEFVKKCYGRTRKEKSIEILNLNTLTEATNKIVLSNGRYEGREYPFRSQHPNASYVFIVINSTEMYEQNVFLVARTNPHVRMLQNKGLKLFMIKLKNFKLYDLHIIPEWIENNRETVSANRIAILGGGSCYTTYQFVSPEYQITYKLLDVANQLKEIRKAFVVTADDKSIFLANINDSSYVFKFFPVHTINGVYDPVVISEQDMISTEGKKKILFLIMGGEKFYKMARAVPIWKPTFITDFRQSIESDYRLNEWTVYLVGLHNFSVNDFHLFAEFVKTFTSDGRFLRDFVHTFGDSIYQSAYEYRDTLPFFKAPNESMVEIFTKFFHSAHVISVLDEE